MRRIGLYRPRRMPSFRGRSIYLDGISDYLDLQGGGSYAFWRKSRTLLTTHAHYRPAAWSFWLTFWPPKTTKKELPKMEGVDASSIFARISMEFRREEPHRADAAGHRLPSGSVQTMSSSICKF